MACDDFRLIMIKIKLQQSSTPLMSYKDKFEHYLLQASVPFYRLLWKISSFSSQLSLLLLQLPVCVFRQVLPIFLIHSSNATRKLKLNTQKQIICLRNNDNNTLHHYLSVCPHLIQISTFYKQGEKRSQFLNPFTPQNFNLDNHIN